MSDWNPRAKINERGICFLVGHSIEEPVTHHVLRLDFNAPRDPKTGGVVAVVMGAGLTQAEADALAEKCNREAMQ